MVAAGGRGARRGGGRGLSLPRVPPQALVDQEQMQMLRQRRRLQPLSTDTFDYSSYHNLDEVTPCGWENTSFGAFFWGKTNNNNNVLELLWPRGLLQLQGSFIALPIPLPPPDLRLHGPAGG